MNSPGSSLGAAPLEGSVGEVAGEVALDENNPDPVTSV
jgi:hypothetical protein